MRIIKNRPNVLIIKTGALGDVVRTTPLLRVLQANVYWLTSPEALGLLPRAGLSGARSLASWRKLSGITFETVFSLEEDKRAAAIATQFTAKKFVGIKLGAKGRLDYTPDAAPWFDMGLLSKLGRRRADALKKRNRRSWQEILFRMAGLSFHGEEYWLEGAPPQFSRRSSHARPFRIGLESRAGDRWPAKVWSGYSELASRLERAGFLVKTLRQRKKLAGYISDIAECDAVVSGDTLAMHLALALGKPTAAIFLCTCPWEIHDYGRLKKIVSPRLLRDFYRKDLSPAATAAVGVDEVFAAVLRLASAKPTLI